MTLALKYRPQRFEQMVGQPVTAAVLKRMTEKDAVPPGLLFAGVRGSGKTSAARILARALDVPDIVEIDAASNGTVADVRQLLETLRFSSGSVVVLDEAHSMSREAFNALLKTLEEPSPGITFVLVTTEPEKIPETVKSRLMEFTFKKISQGAMLQRLQDVVSAEDISADESLLTVLAERADGSMRDALMSLEQCSLAGISSAQEYLELSGEADVAPDLLRALLTGNHAHIFEVTDYVSQRVPDPNRLASSLIQGIRDLLVMRSGGEVKASAEGTRKRKELVQYLEAERLVESLRILWDLRIRARASSDPRSTLDVALVLVSELFTRGREASVRPTPVGADPDKRLSLDEL